MVWYGHSCFRLRGREASVVTDPYDRSLGLALPRLTAQIVTVSHEDPHHSYVAGVGGEPRVLRGPGEYEVASAFITGVRTYRDAEKGSKFGTNTSYVIEIDDLVVCHLGDLGHLLLPGQVEDLESPDILLVPVGGHCTINAAQAAEVVSQLEPKVVVPMHYQIERLAVELDPVDRFCKEMGVDNIPLQTKLTVSKSTLPEQATVFVLEPVT
jgi:L-ascorbate metabolism protein UlaG (beta-lactamase superfamily)